MAVQIPSGDLARTITQEPDQEWPTSVEVRVTWKLPNKPLASRSMVIAADEFFGRGAYGAPMSGQAFIAAIDRLRRQGPPTPPQTKDKADASKKRS